MKWIQKLVLVVSFWAFAFFYPISANAQLSTICEIEDREEEEREYGEKAIADFIQGCQDAASGIERADGQSADYHDGYEFYYFAVAYSSAYSSHPQQ